MFLKKKPLTLFRHAGLYFEEVPDKGRGVFCLQDISDGEMLEVAPVLIMPTEQTNTLCTTILYDYCFQATSYPEKFLKSINIDNPAATVCLPLGIIPICNHRVAPNATYEFTVENLHPYATLKAVRNIPAGEEISVSYGDSWFARRKMNPAKHK